MCFVFCVHRKANLKLTVQRLKLQKQKRGNLADNEKRVIADFLAKGKDDEARIRAEGILKEEATCEAYEVLGSFADTRCSAPRSLHVAFDSDAFARLRTRGIRLSAVCVRAGCAPQSCFASCSCRALL